MTKAELISMVADKCKDCTKAQVAQIFDEAFEAIVRALEVDKKFMVSGFGTFEVRERKAREGRNPRTNEKVQIPASKAVGFKPAAGLKERLNK